MEIIECDKPKYYNEAYNRYNEFVIRVKTTLPNLRKINKVKDREKIEKLELNRLKINTNNIMKIKDCNSCPFKVVDYDDYSIGSSTLIECNLLKHNGNDDYFLKHKNNLFECSDGYVKHNCPLKDKSLKIEM